MKFAVPVLLSLLTLSLLPVIASVTDENQAPVSEGQIRKVLASQVDAWNSGDIPGFMDGYWKSPSLRFASAGKITFGWKATLEGYQKRYTDRDIMGQLAFRDLKILMLSDTYAEVFGRWHLTRKESVGDASGLFTLLMKRTDDGWKVIHDHTSSARPETTESADSDGAKETPSSQSSAKK